MNDSTKAILRQLTPPILLPLGAALLRSWSRYQTADLQEHEHETVLLLKEQHERRNATSAANEIVIRDGLSLKIHPECRFGFDHFCFIAPVMVDELNCFIANTREKTSLLDIGALHGIFSLVFAASGERKRAVAVDASPLAFARLLYNIHKNEYDNITPVECALSDAEGTLQMHYEWEHAVAAGGTGSSPTRLTTRKRRADELCESLSFSPDVVKIDVEGHEVKVLRGMSGLIERSRPLVFLEVHPHRIAQENDDIADLVEIFGSKRYRAFVVGSGGIAIQDIATFTQDQRVMLTPY
jgi:FkbM family methyltransferase